MQTLLGNSIEIDLHRALDEAGKLQPVTASQAAKGLAFDFMTRRLEQLLVDSQIAVEVARAILNERSNNPVLAQQSAVALQVPLLLPKTCSLIMVRACASVRADKLLLIILKVLMLTEVRCAATMQ